MRLIDRFAAGVSLLVCFSVVAAFQERTDVFVDSRDHPAIAYSTAPTHDPVTEVDDKLQKGSIQFTFDRDTGYLRSILDALKIPIESQLLVFSETSAQAKRINPRNPRALYFNDTVAVGWVRGGEFLELAAHDPQQGVVFYTIYQTPSGKPRFKRDNDCLRCHLTWDTLGVPGLQVLSTFQMSDDPNVYATGIVADHRSPLSMRWGGWYVTGRVESAEHLGNVPVIVKEEELKKGRGRTPQRESVAGLFDTSGYPSHSSDVVALMVLEHQTRMTNLLTRIGWEARLAMHGRPTPSPPSKGPVDTGDVPPRVRQAAYDLVEYLLFINEEPLTGQIEGSSGFAGWFSVQGPRDRKGRSLREFDLKRRLLRYPCSYMIYTPAFDALPALAKSAVYSRMWQILSGEEKEALNGRLSLADRQAIIEILRDTKKDLPDYFRGSTK